MDKQTENGQALPAPAGLRTASWPRALWLAVGGFTLALTLLNAIKPLQIDDTAYFYYAAQAARQPLDPYGFEMFWYQYPQPAHEVLAPPLLPYWWALAIRLFGEQPVVWKLWLLPFSGLFVASLGWLLHRFARGLELPLLGLTVLSPTFLPSLNLMLDIPALGLSLLAVALFLRACDRESLTGALLAGLVAGLAMQTKYTGFLALGVMLLYGLLFGKWRLGLVAVVPAICVFGGWEYFIYTRYGASHFLYHLADGPVELSPEHWLALGKRLGNLIGKVRLLLPLMPILGGVAPVLALLGLTALQVRRGLLLGFLGLVVLSYAAVAGVPEPYANAAWSLGTGWKLFTLNQALFGILGLMLSGVLAGTIGRLCRLRRSDWGRGQARRRYRVEWFLVCWLGLELVGYVVLTPFPAVRRVMGLVVVGTLLIGRLASRTWRGPTRRRLVWGIALGGMALGLGVYGIDVRDAFAQKEAAEAAAQCIREQEPGATIWYVGHWGFQFYAERARMKPVVPNRSRLGVGDWLVVPDQRINQQEIHLEKGKVCLWGEPLVVTDRVPLRTVSCFYGGAAPLEHQEGPRLSVQLYRVLAEFVPGDARPSR
ncbi:MAG: glycosyltransferase family 39 protein [Gemmataceae bacterium]|nr:glycosyltransferase family 39 protein [Gemmataceae bacterium]